MARTPLYKSAETEMLSRIKSGDWQIGRRLPNEFVLAEEFGVSQGTMRRALISLEGMGYLSRKPGRGTLVATNAPQQATESPAAAAELRLSDGSELVLEPFRARAGTRTATGAEADMFGTVRLSYLERTLKHKGARAALEEVSVPEAIAPALDEAGPTDLAALLDTSGAAPARITRRASAEITDMALSVALSVDRHTALLRVESRAYDASGRAIGLQILRIAVQGAMLSQE
ncbi:GntR family transcriptional regulator [Rhodobacterales bacterium HKCCE4037]|nr:GntR family transcriptional regulator [Rhodobacterales bacterium HKCCE4037]